MCQYHRDSSPSDSSSTAYSDQAYKRKVFSKDLEYEVVQELDGHVFCEVPDFLETIFPVDEALINSVYGILCRTKHSAYDTKTKRWSHYSFSPPTLEKTLYPQFVKLAGTVSNAVSQAMEVPAWETRAPTQTNGLRWYDCHDATPLSRDPYISEVRPDIVAALGVSAAKQPQIPWSRILVPVEVKKKETDGPALLQLLKYVRLVFRESADRCFVLGLVVACANVSVYLADRTGVIGSTVFNIHDEPKVFIRVIAGLASFSLDRLGWDTSMTTIHQQRIFSRSDLSSLTPKYSYQESWKQQQETTYWVITMPKPKPNGGYGVMDETATETFVLYKGVSMSRGGVIRGRATRVWKAWLWDELHLPQERRRVFVVKDSWRDDERHLEGEFYKKIGPARGVARMRSYSVVKINGHDDMTSSRTRSDLNVQGKPRCIDVSQRDIAHAKISASSPDRDRINTTRYLYALDYLPSFDLPETSPRGRTHSRIVIETYGWSIKYAASLVELVHAVNDVLHGYKTAYEEEVIHRDMSVENLLVTGNTEGGSEGFVIDFDYAKFLNDLAILDDPMSGTRPFMSGELLLGQPYYKSAGTDVRHRFYHDLESVLWILLWICLCKRGAGLRREALHQGTDKALTRRFRLLFEVTDIAVLGTNKQTAIRDEESFTSDLELIDDFYTPLKPLLERLWRILRTGYKTGHFDFAETFSAFMQAFDDAEKTLTEDPPVLTAEQEESVNLERERRRRDQCDWQHTPRPATKSGRAPAQSAIPETPDEDDAPEDDEREDSPTPAPRGRNAETDRKKLILVPDPEPPAPSAPQAPAPAGGVQTRSMSRASAAQGSSNVQTHPPSKAGGSSHTAPKKRGRRGGLSNQRTEERSSAGESGGQTRGTKRTRGRGDGGRGGAGAGRSQPDRKGKNKAG
ncbi:uncharacterized protein C8Q71DRAFT_765355 [Rhodofomes roseus]|uniref:Fungal-type protein kinase domain-containing protein n=1 Tax=Rhodofomes roseus TaxID=34475 RepID=A0ABQ8KCQ6_9APHY|nr:uncharacterized protein C8Q71DRAFT_765355 [Rhodofomes roseus]KAH9835348.1 hypothetical protein C8Q71DRAFT_765355 [Rhodofomes roseus]